ncbi:MAG TPA: DnaA regulatory inactivator Hda [Oxalobacteraceae bacterium]|nr:DnaA regulatory inactivator Hda [Oxalobacteraceae bacterium]
MKQLLLDLNAHEPPALDTFVTGQNGELLALLERVARGAVSGLGERFIYLWGEAGAGKTHLLRALGRLDGAIYLDGEADETALDFRPELRLYLLDDVADLSPQAQIAAFSLFNQVREQGGVLVAAGPQPPALLAVREDLRTRLGWGLIYQLHGLTDDEKIAALEHAAAARGLALSAGVLPYLMTHFKRDMPSLTAMLDALDRYSLETKRPITLPLLKDLLLHDEPGSV